MPRAHNDKVIRRYLLGGLSREERNRLEDRYFADADFFEEIVGAENDLIDAYVRGALSSAERQRFEHQYKNSLNYGARIGFANALTQALESEDRSVRDRRASVWTSVASFLRLHRRELVWSLAVTIALATGVSVLNFQNRHHHELANQRSNTTKLAANDNIPGAQVVPPGTEEHRSQATHVGSQVAELEGPGVLPFRLASTLEERSGAGHETVLVVPQKPTLVRLEMVLDRDEFSSYEAVLETSEGEQVLHSGALKSSSLDGRRMLVWSFSSDRLQPTDYAVLLKGKNHDGSVEDAEAYSFRVSRR